MDAYTHTLALPCSPESPYRALSLRCSQAADALETQKIVITSFTLLTALRMRISFKDNQSKAATHKTFQHNCVFHTCQCSLITRCNHPPTGCNPSSYTLHFCICIGNHILSSALLDINKMKLSTMFFFLKEGN